MRRLKVMRALCFADRFSKVLAEKPGYQPVDLHDRRGDLRLSGTLCELTMVCILRLGDKRHPSPQAKQRGNAFSRQVGRQQSGLISPVTEVKSPTSFRMIDVP